MRLTSSISAIRRLVALEQRRAKVRSVGLWPAIVQLDAWEAEAMPTQAALVSDTQWEPPAQEGRAPSGKVEAYQAIADCSAVAGPPAGSR